jgi:hypothetical protein
LDEAGISSKVQEPWLVVAGLLVHADDQLDKLYTELEGVMERHIPEKHRHGLVLHTSEIYGGNGKVFDEKRNPEWTREKRWAILADLAKIPEKTNILITATPIERATFPSDLSLDGEASDPTINAVAVAYSACLLEVDIWLRENAKRENCMVIVEDNPQARSRIKQVHRYNQDKSIPFPDDLKMHFPFRRIRNDPAFQDKLPSNPLVLADFVAFVIKRYKMGDARITPFLDPWRHRVEALRLNRAR